MPASAAVVPAVATAPALPVVEALQPVLPAGIRRGSTVAVSGSMSLLLAVVAAATVEGSWCALVGMPPIGADAAVEQGVVLSRLPVVPAPGDRWPTVVGALLDAVDVVIARPPTRLSDGEIRRLAARTRARGSVLVPYLDAGARWPGADVRLCAGRRHWSGIEAGYGRLRRRRLTVTAEGRGTAARSRSVTLWLPADDGGCAPALAPVAPDRPAELTVARAG
ncbi:MAG TPA: hypothetical protein VG708_09430 [Mycobacteriales bacterium]|nr:hypothetical protein [Mycobacteriales bacterium]